MSTPCSIALLESALAGNLPVEDETSLHCHLEECEQCSAALERMAGGTAWCEEAASLLAKDELDADLPGHAFASGDEWSDVDFTVEHLEPTDDSNMLGRLGDYDVMEIIGRGGMGVVLKAFDRELKRCVAIKVLSPQLAQSPLARKRFAREAQAAAAVVHPNVLAIHQVQPNGRLPFLVMPLVAGESLAQRLTAQGRLELKEVLRVGMQVAAGLAAAHEQGLVHRDVKPANILLEKGIERAVITDFGLARAADDVALTRWGIIAGTPQYMSPEQARGEPLDGRSDLFSLGCVLYEMATGVSPFRTDSMMATMRRLVDDPPQALASLNPELPPWFIAIVDRLLEKDPSRRFGSAKEVSELLERCLAHLQQPANVPLPDVLITLRHDEMTSRGHRRAALVGVMSTFFSPIRVYFKGVLVMTAILGAAFLGLMLTAEPPNIAGEWTGEDWGQVVLKKTNEAEYTGTYTDTVGKQAGEIQLKWSRIERRFNGAWREEDDRFGDISIHVVGDEIRGAITTDAKSKINPATPRLADLTWIRAKGYRVEDHGGRADAPAPHAHTLQFDGTRYATLPQPLKFTSGDFTISLWFNPTRTDKSQFLFIRGLAWDDKKGDIGLKINPNSGDLDFEANTGGNAQWLFGWDAPESLLRSAFRLNQWNHVVVTRSGDTYTLWMNGTKIVSEDSTSDISDSDDINPFVMGGMMSNSVAQDVFEGALDEFRIVHRCLPDREIAALYNHGDGLDGSPAQAPADGSLVTGYEFHPVPPPDPSAGPDGSHSALEFRIAPLPASLDAAERKSCSNWLQAGRIGLWWKGARISGRVPSYAWFLLSEDVSDSDRMITETYHGKKYLLLSDKPGQAMTPDQGWSLESVGVNKGNGGSLEIRIRLNERGGQLLSALSAANLKGRLAMIVNGKVLSAPTIQSTISRDVMISGRFSQQEAQALVNVLMHQRAAASSTMPKK